MATISIIVPVYNVGQYLEKCLNSLVNQSFKDIEIIAINDGSTDKSGQILEDFGKKYENIRIVNQENSGISSARNKGLELATGKYVAFIDSDDSISLSFCEKMLETAENTGADITVCDFYEVRGEEKEEIKLPSFEKCTVFDEPYLLFDINSSPWNKLYKKAFLINSGVRFPLGLKYEDAAFIQQLMAKAAVFAKVDEPMVYYMIRSKSETTVVKPTVFDIFKILDMIINGYKESGKYEQVKTYVEYFTVNRITIYNIQQYFQEEPSVISDFINKGFAYLEEHFPKWRENPPFNATNGIAKRIIKKNKGITKAVVWCLRKIH